MVPFKDVLPEDLAKLHTPEYVARLTHLREQTPELKEKTLFNILLSQAEDNEPAKFIVSTPFVPNDPSILIPAKSFEELFLALVTTRYSTHVQRDLPTSDAAVDEKWFCHLCAIQLTELLTNAMTKTEVNAVIQAHLSNYVSLHEQSLIILEETDKPKLDYYLVMENSSSKEEPGLYPITLYRTPHRAPDIIQSPHTLQSKYSPLSYANYPTYLA